MSFQPIDSINQQILDVLEGVIADATEKQNAADAIETYLNNNQGFLKEILNDTLRDTINSNHNSHAIVSIDEQNQVTVQDVSKATAQACVEAIKQKQRKDSISAAIEAADTQDILGESHEFFVNAVSS